MVENQIMPVGQSDKLGTETLRIEEKAKRLLENEFFKEEIEKLKQNYIQTIVHSSIEDIDAREQAFRMIRAIDQIYAHFECIAVADKMEEKRWKIF